MKTRKLRLLSFVLAVAMMFAVMPVSAFAAEGKKTTPSDGHYEITVTEKSDTEDAIADKSNKSGVQKALEAEYEFSSAADDRFDAVKSLTVRTAPGIVLNKADFQFLSGVKVNSATSYSYAGGSKADATYYWLHNLTEVDLTDANLKDDKFPERAFCGNTKIQVVIFPSTLVSTGFKTFCYMKELTYVGTEAGKASNIITFPETMTTIENAAFFEDPKLSCKLELPETVTYMGPGAFQGDPITGKIVIRAGVTLEQNGAHLFENTKISSLKIENGMDELGNSIAKNCPIDNITIPNNIKKIGDYAFYYGNDEESNITAGDRTINETIVIPESVEYVGEGAFSFAGNSIKNIIVENADITFGAWALNHLNAKIYFKNVVNNSGTSNNHTGNIWNSNTSTIFNTNGGTIPTDGNGNVTAETDNNGFYIPVKYAEKFVEWETADNGKTYTAKWTPYETKVEPKVEANADPASKTVDITVDVEAAPAELAGATATLNFTDADGHDDSDNVVEVKVNGTPVNKDENGKYTANLNDLMNTGKGAEAVMLADVNEDAVVSGTVERTALLTVTYKNPGKHRVEIVLNAENGDVICKKPVTVEIAPEPGTLNLTGCTAKLEDGTPVENGAKVPVGAEVTVAFDKDADSDLVLNGWKVTPETLTDTNDKLVKDITADTFTFKMPETDKGVTIEALTKAKAAAAAEDDSMDAAAVVTGVVLGTGTAILAYHIGTEVYAEQVLGKDAAIPRTREEVALKAWELAGKPAVELNGEPLSEAAQAEKWAVESGLMQNVDGSFNGSKKMSKLKALRTLDAAKKLG